MLQGRTKFGTLPARQSNAKTSTSQGSSCSASDRDDGGGGQSAPNGGEWDVSGTPNDYTFTARLYRALMPGELHWQLMKLCTAAEQRGLQQCMQGLPFAVPL